MTEQNRLFGVTDAQVAAISEMVDRDLRARRWEFAREALEVLLCCEPLERKHLSRMGLALRHLGRETEAEAYEEIASCVL